MTRFQNSHWRFAFVLGVAAAVAAVLIGVSQVGAGAAPISTAPISTAPISTAPVTADPAPAGPSLFAGIEQQGIALGSPDAPVTLVEYADVQCPYCAQWALETLPILVKEYVAAGNLRIVFHGLAFLGADSDKALRTAIVAGEDNHLWDLIHGLYAGQGAENTGWVSDELVSEIAAGVPGLDADKLLAARWEDAVEPAMKRAADAATSAGVHSTPAFQIGPTGGRLELIQVTSLGPEGIRPAIDTALAR
jgi:protein-disulfide isomerase